ncbi:MAG: galactose mutarotase [Bacteroidetes bacterium]|nr:galactose mutarotase [Bacteroidota bacterium]
MHKIQNENISVDLVRDPSHPGVVQVRLYNRGITVDVINIGCAITGIYTSDRYGNYKNIVAAFGDISFYRVNDVYLGAVVGRYANRIQGGCFLLDGREVRLSINNGHNHLHGGVEGFSHKLWSLVSLQHNGTECRAKFSYTSPDGEEGYPGELIASVEYILDGRGRLHLLYEAVSSQSTPVNLTNHTYFNLTGFEDPTVLGHLLTINAASYTEKNAGNTSTGIILPVAETPLDFRTPRLLADGIGCFGADMGYDHNFVLQQNPENTLIRAAVLQEPATGRSLTVYTSKPGLQVYTANYWDGSITGIQGKPYIRHGAVALETQAFPGSVRHRHFPDTILRPGEIYRATTIFAFSLGDEIQGQHNEAISHN